MIQVYRDYVHSANEISGQILGLSEISYAIKPDWTPELPEVTITTTIDDFAPGEKIVVAQRSDTTKQVVFYVKEIKYDYATQKYTLVCPHILEKLAYIKAMDIPAPLYGDSFGDWSDVTPTGSSGYTLYNNQGYDPQQGNYIWERKYYQAIFLIKMMIHRVTGTGVNSISSSTLESKDSFYAKRWEYYGAQEQIYTYGELGVNIGQMQACGTSYWNQNTNPDYFVRAGLMDCLTLLKHLLCALKIYVDIFRSDYKMDVIAFSSAPSNAATLGRTDEILECYRRYGVRRSGLDADPDWVWGYYDDVGMAWVFYTWGVDNPDREILESVAEEEDTGVDEAKQISVTFPNLFRIHNISINTNNYYRSCVQVIKDTIDDKRDWDMWLAAFYAFWQPKTSKYTFETALTALEGKYPAARINVEDLKMRYERIT